MKKIIILGATSAIAQSAARIWAQRGDRLYLVARSAEKLTRVASDLRVRGAEKVVEKLADLDATDAGEAIVAAAKEALGGIDIALVAFGELEAESALRLDSQASRKILQTDFVSPALWLDRLALEMESQGFGVLAAIGSVAGDRGRGSNYHYGSAKGGLALFLSGLRNRLYRRGVAVVTLKPGFVDTPMTAAFKKGPLWASADRVGRGIVRAIDRRKSVAYLPGFWRLIMAVIRSIPEAIFKRLSL